MTIEQIQSKILEIPGVLDVIRPNKVFYVLIDEKNYKTTTKVKNIASYIYEFSDFDSFRKSYLNILLELYGKYHKIKKISYENKEIIIEISNQEYSLNFPEGVAIDPYTIEKIQKSWNNSYPFPCDFKVEFEKENQMKTSEQYKEELLKLEGILDVKENPGTHFVILRETDRWNDIQDLYFNSSFSKYTYNILNFDNFKQQYIGKEINGKKVVNLTYNKDLNGITVWSCCDDIPFGWNVLSEKDNSDIKKHWNDTFTQFPIENVYWDIEKKTLEQYKEELLKEDNVLDVIIKDDKVYALRDKRLIGVYDTTPCVFYYLEDFKKKWIGKIISSINNHKIQDIYFDNKTNKWLVLEFSTIVDKADHPYHQFQTDWQNNFPLWSNITFTWKYKEKTSEQIKEELLKNDNALDVVFKDDIYHILYKDSNFKTDIIIPLNYHNVRDFENKWKNLDLSYDKDKKEIFFKLKEIGRSWATAYRMELDWKQQFPEFSNWKISWKKEEYGPSMTEKALKSMQLMKDAEKIYKIARKESINEIIKDNENFWYPIRPNTPVETLPSACSLEEKQNPVIDEKGNKWFKSKGKRHRLDGPAIEWANGDKSWYVEDKLHRLDGPACEYADGSKFWWIEGKEYTEEEFLKMTKENQTKEKKEITPSEDFSSKAESICKVDQSGNKRWFNSKGQLHRLDGPALEYANGNKYWYKEGKYHRLDEPAVESANGDKHWYIEGKRHRLDGPAIEYANGSKSWYVEDKLHRLDGPACEYADGSKFWWIEGERLSEQEFLAQTEKEKKEMKSSEVLDCMIKQDKIIILIENSNTNIPSWLSNVPITKQETVKLADLRQKWIGKVYFNDNEGEFYSIENIRYKNGQIYIEQKHQVNWRSPYNETIKDVIESVKFPIVWVYDNEKGKENKQTQEKGNQLMFSGKNNMTPEEMTPEQIKAKLLKTEGVLDVILKDNYYNILLDKRRGKENFPDMSRLFFFEDFQRKWIGKVVYHNSGTVKIQNLSWDKNNRTVVFVYTYVDKPDGSLSTTDLASDWCLNFPYWTKDTFAWDIKKTNPSNEEIKDQLLKDPEILNAIVTDTKISVLTENSYPSYALAGPFIECMEKEVIKLEDLRKKWIGKVVKGNARFNHQILNIHTHGTTSDIVVDVRETNKTPSFFGSTVRFLNKGKGAILQNIIDDCKPFKFGISFPFASPDASPKPSKFKSLVATLAILAGIAVEFVPIPQSTLVHEGILEKIESNKYTFKDGSSFILKDVSGIIPKGTKTKLVQGITGNYYFEVIQ